jgi:hypothetical protein
MSSSLFYMLPLQSVFSCKYDDQAFSFDRPLEQVVNLLANIDACHINDMIDVINHWDFLYSR